MLKEIARVNMHSLSVFNKTLDLSDKLQAENQHHPAEWFDTPEKRLKWWFDLEPQWRRAFNEAVFMRQRLKDAAVYMPNDAELEYIFSLKTICMCGFGSFLYRNNSSDIDFQLTNLTGVANLTNLTRLEVDYNGQIESLEPLRHLTKLVVLWCDNNNISDLSPLSGLSSLEDLCCWNNPITDISPLIVLPMLRHITIGILEQPDHGIDFSLLPNCRISDISTKLLSPSERFLW